MALAASGALVGRGAEIQWRGAVGAWRRVPVTKATGFAGAPGSVARTLNTGGSTIDTRIFVQHDSFMQLRGARDTRSPEQSAGQHAALPRIRGWLLVYIVALAIFLLHGAVLTVGSVVAYADPAATGMSTRVPLGFLVYYDITNVTLIVYGIVLFIMMAHRRRSAIVNNIVFNILAVVFLVTWHLFGEKSNIGTVIDSVPNLAGALYFLLSRRPRSIFLIRRPAGSADE
jgi:hypothetical protein